MHGRVKRFHTFCFKEPCRYFFFRLTHCLCLFWRLPEHSWKITSKLPKLNSESQRNKGENQFLHTSFVTAVMDWLWCVAGLSVLSAMIVSWRLSPVAAEAKRGDDWRRPSLNRRRPSLSQQVCFTQSTSQGGREEGRKFGFSNTPPRSHSHPSHVSFMLRAHNPVCLQAPVT